MESYKLISLLNVLIIYLISFLPTFFILFRKKTFSDTHSFIKKISLSVFIEILIFIFIYIFAEKISKIVSLKTNIQNYTYYCMKILFISSSITGIHFAIPAYFFHNKKIKESILLLFSKILYFPIMFLGFNLFNTKGIYFSIPLCDILYTLFLLLFLKKFLYPKKINSQKK